MARFGEHFDEVLSGLIADRHDPIVAAEQLDELVLLTVLAQFAAAGLWAPEAMSSSGARTEVVQSDQNPRVRLHRYAIVYQPGSVVDVVTFEGYAIQSDQTVVRTAAVRTSAESLRRLSARCYLGVACRFAPQRRAMIAGLANYLCVP